MRLSLAACVLAFPGIASASVASMCSNEETRCERASLSASKLEKAPYDFDFDTGWLPNNSPIQVRLVAKLHSRVQVDLEGTLDATWPEPITLTPKGKKGAGRISLDEGLEIEAQAKFSVTIGGKTYAWTGNIPGIPSVNLLAKGSQTFDPWAYQGEMPPAAISADTGDQPIVKVSLTDQLIPIPGISGGFELDGALTFAATYDTLRIGFDDPNGPPAIDLMNPSTRLLITHAPAFDTNVFIHGELVRQATLHFIPAFYFTILGNNFKLPLANIPVMLPASKPEPWDFDSIPVHVPLPEIGNVADLDLGNIPIGVATSALVPVNNLGEERLVLDDSSVHPIAFVDTKHLVLDPKMASFVRVLLTPSQEGKFDVPVTITTNDPLKPTTEVHILGSAIRMGLPPKDQVGMSGGCGCRMETSERASSVWAGLGLVLLAFVRRRR